MFSTTLYLLSSAILCGGWTQCEIEKDTVFLSRQGVATMDIVIAPRATRSARFGAIELREHLRAITGADFPIVTPTNRTPGTHALYIGPSAPVVSAGYSAERLARQELLVAARNGDIFLLGRDAPDYCTNIAPFIVYRGLNAFDKIGYIPPLWSEHGSLDAVYDFLEKDCGVDWLDATDFGTVIRKNASLAVTLSERRVQPFVFCRDIGNFVPEWWQYGTKGYEEERRIGYQVAHTPNHWTAAVINTQNDLYLLRRRFGGERMHANHSFGDWYDRFLNTNSPIFEAKHPEYFARSVKKTNKGETFIEVVYDASKRPPQLCYSNPGTIAQAIADVREYFDHGGKRVWNAGAKRFERKPIWGRDVCCLEPMDNDGFCGCEVCRREYPANLAKISHWNGTTRNVHWFGFVNKVAREIAKSHPTKRLSTLAYMSHTAPPPFRMEDNVIVHFCHHANRTPPAEMNAQLASQLAEWAKVVKRGNLAIWFYNCFPKDDFGAKGFCFPGIFVDLHARQYRELVRRYDIRTCVFYCGCSGWLEDYAISRLLWDPEADPKAIKDRYFSAYGKAAEPIRAYCELVEERFSNKAYCRKRCGHENVQIAWEWLCPPEIASKLEELSKAAMATTGLSEEERQRVRFWKASVSDYIAAGAKKYHQPK